MVGHKISVHIFLKIEKIMSLSHSGMKLEMRGQITEKTGKFIKYVEVNTLNGSEKKEGKFSKF